jgi:hypothetical protein
MAHSRTQRHDWRMFRRLEPGPMQWAMEEIIGVLLLVCNQQSGTVHTNM